MIQICLSVPSSYLEQIESSFIGRTNDAFIEGADCRIEKLKALGGTFINQMLDIPEDLVAPLNYSLLPISDVTQRGGNWSKTINVPATKTNNSIFSYIFDVNHSNRSGSLQYNPDYNPKLRVSAKIFVDLVEVMVGYARLMQIVTDSENQVMLYEVQIVGEVADLYSAMSNAKLKDLDFGAYNHNQNVGNMVASWSNTPTNGYVYPIIIRKGNPNIDKIEATQMFPALFVKTIVDKIFTEHGYTYSSDSFFNDAIFQKLIVPSHQYSFSQSALNQRKFRASKTISQQVSIGTTIIFQDDSTGDNYDTNNIFNTTTSVLTIPADGYYYFRLSIKLNYNGIASLVNKKFTPAIGISTGGVTYDWVYGSLAVVHSSGVGTNTHTVISTPKYYRTGDLISFNFQGCWANNGDPAFSTNVPSGITVNIEPDSFIEANPIKGSSAYSFPYDFVNFFTTEMTQKEFMAGITKMFNLYTEATGKGNELKVLTRDVFYTNDVVNWDAKLDLSSNQTLIPRSDIQVQNFTYQYKDGSDLASIEYKKATGRGVGSRIMRFTTDFTTGEKKVELPFGTAMSYLLKGDDKILPHIVTENGKMDEIQILYFSGTLTSSTYEFVDAKGASLGVYTSYPFVSHTDSFTNPTLDLYFGQLDYYAVPDGFKISSDNLINKYWYTTLKEIIDIDSKVFIGYFYLRPNDIATLTFRSNYFFKNSYWHLTDVSDYDPSGKSLTKCTFVKTIPIQVPSAVVKKLGSGDTIFTGEVFFKEDIGTYKPVIGVGIGGTSDSNTDSNNGTVYGGGNAGPINQGICVGLNNNLHPFTDAVSFIGCDNIRPAVGLTNTNAISCFDFDVLQSNYTYFANRKLFYGAISGGKVLNLTNAMSPYYLSFDDEVVICNTSAGNVEVYLPDTATILINNQGAKYTFKKTSSAHSLIVRRSGTNTIDNTDNHVLTTNMDSHIVQSDGTNYWIIGTK